jgi:hypothetical protein
MIPGLWKSFEFVGKREKKVMQSFNVQNMNTFLCAFLTDIYPYSRLVSL